MVFGRVSVRHLAARQAGFRADDWLHARGIDPAAGRLVSLFCYEPPALPGLLRQLAEADAPTQLLVTAGRAAVVPKSPCARFLT